MNIINVMNSGTAKNVAAKSFLVTPYHMIISPIYNILYNI